MVKMHTPLSVLDENELEMQKKAIDNKKSMLLLNLTAKEQQLHSGGSFHPQITKNVIRELHQEIHKLDNAYNDVSRLQKQYRHHLWKKKWMTKWSRFWTCACIRDVHPRAPIDKGRISFRFR